jgi:hypothetical protein
MLDFKKPNDISLMAIGVTFLLSAGILYLSRPSWIQRLNSKGKAEIVPTLLLCYSVTFALVCGVAALIVSSKQKVGENDLGKPSASLLLSPDMAHSYLS